jgi:hypothetical protein
MKKNLSRIPWPRLITALTLGLWLSACATVPSGGVNPEKLAGESQPGVAGSNPEKLGRAFGSAITQPLSDLNLLPQKIPEILQNAVPAPYAIPESRACSDLHAEIAQFDEALGIDFSFKRDNDKLIDFEYELNNQAVGFVRRSTEALVPFRSWVRKLTGAERASRQVATAIQAGTVRRAFLKGMLLAQNCSLDGQQADKHP